MSSDDAMVDERLSVFDDEPDLNDWFEVICGSLMAVIGIFQLISPAILLTRMLCVGSLLLLVFQV